MNSKILGALLTVSACAFCGFLTAARDVSNIKQLQDVINILDYMIYELHYRATPLPQLCRRSGEQCGGKIGQIFIAFSDELETQISPNVEICVVSVLCRIGNLDSMIYTLLHELGTQLGKFDLMGQIHCIENCRDHTAAKLEQLSQNKESRLRSYKTLGLCAGAAIAILFV